MIVTINTDASFSHKHKIGAYAFYLICDQGKFEMSGVLKEAKDPTDAELKCIANALFILLNSNITGVTKIIINSDALYAFDKVGRKKKDKAGKVTADLLRKLRQKYLPAHEQSIMMHEFRHVKAHSGTDEPRKWANDWCDKQAKKQLRQRISSI